jgi:peptide/nickel transport system substrate-binding protein
MSSLPRRNILILALSLLAFSACRRDKEGSDKQVFRLNLVAGLESLDPAFAKDNNTMWSVHMIYNTLVETDENLNLVPSLARSWKVSDDGLLYTFYLRDSIFFQDNPLFPSGKGRKMTAGDVVYSFNRLIDPAVASSGAWIFNDRVVEKDPFSAPDDTTVQIRLKAPFRPLPEILSMPYCSVIPREVAEHWGKDFRSHPCGTGPFMFHLWDEGNILVLHKNPSYWDQDIQGRPLPYLDAVQMSFFDSKATEFLLFLQKKLDFVNSIDGSFKDLVLSKRGELKPEFSKQFHLNKGVYLNTEYLGFNTDSANALIRNSPIRNLLVRQAINYAIDRAKIVTYFKNGAGIPATGGFTPPGMAGFSSIPTYGYNYDPSRAAALLAQAGFPHGKGLAPIKIFTPDNFADIVNFVASQLQDIGIRIQVEVMQPGILKEQMSKEQAVFFRAQWIADYPDAETYLAFFNSRFPAPPNYTRFNNRQFDQWYDQSMNAPDTLRWQLYRQMDSLAINQAPLVPLYYDQRLHFIQNNVTGISSTPMNLIDLKKVRLTR